MSRFVFISLEQLLDKARGTGKHIHKRLATHPRVPDIASMLCLWRRALCILRLCKTA